MRLKYHGPFDAVEVAGQTVKRNHQFEVDADTAGRPPEPRVADAQAELAAAVAAIDHDGAARLRDEIAGLDFGEGLLAQPDNFVAVETKATKKDGDK